MRRRIVVLATSFAVVLGVIAGYAVASSDFGLDRDATLASRSMSLFGIKRPLAASSTLSIDQATANADPRKLATLARPLTARVVTAGKAAPIIDMMALWPNDTNPTTIIACNEGGASDPGLQRIDIASGNAQTILTGTVSCDPLHATAWGTIVFGEEAGGGTNGGRVYELMDPMNTTGVTLDRTSGTFTGGTGAGNFAVRPALGRLSFEGLAIYDNGLVYYGDENRPGGGNPGGAYFKFVPATPYNPASGPITDLSQSPLAGGTVYGLRLGKRSPVDNGQGTETGLGTWLFVNDSSVTTDPDLRAATLALKLTGYYRPEDAEIDHDAEANGRVKWCANNTGNEGSGHTWGNTVCVTDGSIADATSNPTDVTPEVQFFVIGTWDLSMMDNIAQQPARGNWIIHEDGDVTSTHKNNDLWDCLPDGADADSLSDGCIRIATLNDWSSNNEGAEWTGGVWDSTGTRFFVSVQHNVTGHGVVLEVTGWGV